MKKRSILAVAVALAILTTLVGCDKAQEAISAVSTAVVADGREYGQAYTGAMGEELENAFFSYKVNSAKMVDEVGEYVPDEATDAFLIVNITVTNVFKDDPTIPMSGSDFTIGWGEGEDNMTYAQDWFIEGQMKDEYELQKGESVTEDVIFIVPRGKSTYTVEYLEFWDDDFEGNTYSVPLTVENATEAGTAV